MKSIVKLMIALLMIALPAAASAQKGERRHDPAQREALAKAQAAEIAKEMKLNDELTQKYTETFLDFQREIWSMDNPRHRRMKEEDMTEAQAKEQNEWRLKSDQRFLEIRKKYYHEYSKFLTQKQILQANRLEKQMIDRMMQQARRHGKKNGPKSSK
mgnify:CR=1 FL=1